MTDLNNALGWSDPIPWGQDRPADAIPNDIKPGMWVRSDMIVRPNMTHWLTKPGNPYPPPYVSDFMWEVIDGESFKLEVAEPYATHRVASYYRIWAGELPSETENKTEAPSDEEELLPRLLENYAEKEKANASA
ncbi:MULTISPECIES: hypothetical protein [unclassified Ruegeria]|uniref:hypothetical protein n=1 Tax=unclassified Ruegeria TaxID=2625375 RepID=UPI001489737E|nr:MULTISPECIES: hypothetical protein [unclassified Ruegeria]NOD76740.1 hypothetical protein [Ruegeria sp. HKCCD4332]NOD88250.1 hypothetical protein [Ruegeria sp. HKCCD4318]NOE13159.1 hypothetical protein [Ruegeria sp. HKCCD4318-2]NOG11299.1 hypothetical protein [Ruegeria sp. HKCCD4315]